MSGTCDISSAHCLGRQGDPPHRRCRLSGLPAGAVVLQHSDTAKVRLVSERLTNQHLQHKLCVYLFSLLMNNSETERKKTFHLLFRSVYWVDSPPRLHRPSLSVQMKKRKKKENETGEFSEAAAAKWNFLPPHFHNPAAASCSAHQPAAQLLLNQRVVNRISAGQHHLPSPGGRRAAPTYANAAATRLSAEHGSGTCTSSAPEN